MRRKNDNRYKRDYSNEDILQYLVGIKNVLGRTPTFRDPQKIPGPSARTIVRRFGKWSVALKKAGIRPVTNQLMKGERTFIRLNWRKMTDVEIAKILGVTRDVILYYRQNYHLWKNRKGTAKETFRKKALKLYGKSCEVCDLKIFEWHHIVPKSRDPLHWCILCPTCHAVITKNIVKITNRNELLTKLKPFMKDVYSNLKI